MAIEPVSLFQCLKSDLIDHFGVTGVADFSYDHWPDMSLKQAFGKSIYDSFLKKLETGRTSTTDKLALEKFLRCNLACKNWTLPTLTSRTETLLGLVRQAVYEFWTSDGGIPITDNPLDHLHNGMVGPGVSIGSRGNSFYAKLFSSPLTCSDQSLYKWYRRYIRSFPEWNAGELTRICSYGEASVITSNRLSFVPKNDEISRCICIEPTLNSYFQLGFGRIIERRLSERFGISLDKQQFVNRYLACLGSQSGDMSTIDLSSASDSISLEMLRWLLPHDFFSWLCKYRSTSCEIKGQGTVPLFMVSTMGNGYTFPLQTMIFACVVVAAMTFRGIPYKPSGYKSLWGVNGDDIICPSETTRDVIETLNILGFVVNDDKTFVEGPFRESCGHDYFNGSNVRGVYVKTLKTPSSRYSVVNLLTRFMTRSDLLLPRTYDRLTSSLRLWYVPRWEGMDSGIHAPLSVARKTLERDRVNNSYFYRCITPNPIKLRVSDCRIVVPRSSKQLIFNPSGLHISFLQGSISSHSIGIREDAVRYRAKRRSTSFWDAEPLSSGSFLPEDFWRRWESVVQVLSES